MVTIVGTPISVVELIEIVQRIQSGQSTLEQECAKNMRPATYLEKRSIEPAVECRKFFPKANDLWIDWFVSNYGILHDSWEHDSTILEQIHKRFEKAREAFFNMQEPVFLQHEIRKWENHPNDENVKSLLEALRKALKCKGESAMQFGLKFEIPEVKDAEQHEVVVTVDGQAPPQRATYPGKAKETEEMTFTAGNTVDVQIISRNKEGKEINRANTAHYTVTDDDRPKGIIGKRLLKPDPLGARPAASSDAT